MLDFHALAFLGINIVDHVFLSSQIYVIMFQTLMWLAMLTTGLMLAVLTPGSVYIAHYCRQQPNSMSYVLDWIFGEKIPKEVIIAQMLLF